jgi:branched-chain amino acid transport system permease protein
MTVLRRLGTSTAARHLLPAIIAAIVLYLGSGQLSEYRNNQLATIAIYVCAMAGLTMLTGLSGQLSIGHGAFVFVGAYTLALVYTHHTTGNGGLAWVLLSSVVVAALVGAVVGMAAARLRGPYLAGVTLALAIGLPVLPKWDRLSGLGGHAGLPVIAPVPPTSIDYFRYQALVCCLCALVVLVVLANLGRSRLGRSLRALRDDEIAASLAGLPVSRLQVLAFTISAACAGLAGGLYGYVNGSVGPDSFPLSLSFFLLAGIVFGGLGSLAGAVYGAVLIVLLPVWSQDVAQSLSLPTNVENNLPLAVFGLVLIVAILVLPGGVQSLVRRAGALVGTRLPRSRHSRSRATSA